MSSEWGEHVAAGIAKGMETYRVHLLDRSASPDVIAIGRTIRLLNGGEYRLVAASRSSRMARIRSWIRRRLCGCVR